MKNKRKSINGIFWAAVILFTGMGLCFETLPAAAGTQTTEEVQTETMKTTELMVCVRKEAVPDVRPEGRVPSEEYVYIDVKEQEAETGAEEEREESEKENGASDEPSEKIEKKTVASASELLEGEALGEPVEEQPGWFYVRKQKTVSDDSERREGEIAVPKDGILYVFKEDLTAAKYCVKVQKDGGEWEACSVYDQEAGTVLFRDLTLGGIAFPETAGAEENTLVRVEIDGEKIAREIKKSLPFYGNKEDWLGLEPVSAAEPVNGLVCQYELQDGPVKEEEREGAFGILSNEIVTVQSVFAAVCAKACHPDGEIYAETRFLIPVAAPKVDNISFVSGLNKAEKNWYAGASDPTVVLSYEGEGVSSAVVQCAGKVKVKDHEITVDFRDLPEGEQTIELCGKEFPFIVDTSPPAVRIVQSRVKPKRSIGRTDYYSEAVAFEIEIYDQNLDLNKSELTLNRNGKNEVLELAQKENDGREDSVWTASFVLDGQAKNPEMPGDILYGISGFITDLAGNGAVQVEDHTNEKFTVDNGRVFSGGDAQLVCIDKSAPDIRIAPPGLSGSRNSIKNRHYFGKNQSITMTVTDVNLDPDRSKVLYVLNREGRTSKKKIPFRKVCTASDGAVHTLEIPITDGDKISSFRVMAKDYVNHTIEDDSLQPYEYIVDTAAPEVRMEVAGPGVESFFTNGTDVYVKFKETSYAAGGTKAIGQAQKVTLQVTVTDNNIETDTQKGYEHAYYVTNDFSNGIRFRGTIQVNKRTSVTYTQSMTVKPDSAGDLCFRITIRDLAGNAAQGFLSRTLPGFAAEKFHKNSKGTISGKVIADRLRPTSASGEHAAPVIQLKPNISAAGTLDGNVPLYSGSVSYELTVSDPVYVDSMGKSQYSGLASASWTIQSGKDGLISDPNRECFLYGEQTAEFTIPVRLEGTGEADDLTLTVTVVDCAGNTAFCAQKLAVDNEKPRVTIAYDNQNSRNGRYFKEARTATITVEDLNFDAGRTGIISGGEISGWNQSGNTWTATIVYAADGDYQLEMTAADRAGNRAEIDYTNHGVNAAPQDFTIDRTRPVIQASFDNNKASHKKYYSKERTATILVEERNFESGEVDLELRASLDGEEQAAPVWNGSWTQEGEIHSATIFFLQDGDYSGTVRYTDPAGNEAEPCSLEAFTIDKTPPLVQLTGVKNKEARKTSVTLQLRLYDRNFDENSLQLTWTRTDRLTQTKDLLAVQPPGKKALQQGDNLQGYELIFENPDETMPENDGIYRLGAVLTDLAGNTACLTDASGNPCEEGILYSLNRFGSVYDIPDTTDTFRATKDLLERYYTKEAPVISIRETNPDALKNQTIRLASGGAIRTLQEGSEYEIVPVKEGGDGWNQVVYNIFKTAFTDDTGAPVQGEYTITLYSEDDAGNLNSNRTNIRPNRQDLSFVLDNEPPAGYMNIAGLLEGKDSIKADKTTIDFYWEDNTGMKEAALFLNGKQIRSATEEELAAGTAQLTVQESNEPQKACAVLTDMAENQTKLAEMAFYLNSSSFRQLLRRPPLPLFGAAAALVGAFALKIILTMKRRRNSKQGRTGQS